MTKNESISTVVDLLELYLKTTYLQYKIDFYYPNFGMASLIIFSDLYWFLSTINVKPNIPSYYFSFQNRLKNFNKPTKMFVQGHG